MNESTPSAPLRLLIACSACRAQHDATGLAPRSRLHCACGAELEVPRTDAHDAAVVRCASCGGPRQGQAPSCGFCGADFTVHEQDLHTVCPGCMARISDRARFCHACGGAVVPMGTAPEASSRVCPACGDNHHLVSRSMGEAEVTVLECPRCAGLWLGVEAFRQLESRAKTEAVPWRPDAGTAPNVAPHAGVAAAVAYRPCCVCGSLMNRQNYGRKSGVVIDVCAEHGLWFDRDELTKILSWVREGGLARADSLARQSAAAEARNRPAPPSTLAGSLTRDVDPWPTRSMWEIGLDLLDLVFDRVRR